MKLSSLLCDEYVLCGGQAASYEEAQRLLVGLLPEMEGFDPATALREFALREALASTVVAEGIAVPHARLPGVDDLYVLLGTFPEGVPCPAGRYGPARLVAAFLIPEGKSNLYLRGLSAFLRWATAPGSLDRIVALPEASLVVDDARTHGPELGAVLTASDVMRVHPPSLAPEASVREAIDLMARFRLADLPVENADGDLVGWITAHDLLRLGLPDYLLEMDSTGFLDDFEPFAELLAAESSTTLAEVMREPPAVFEASSPFIHVASRLVKGGLRSAAVVDGGRLSGIVILTDLLRKVVRA